MKANPDFAAEVGRIADRFAIPMPAAVVSNRTRNCRGAALHRPGFRGRSPPGRRASGWAPGRRQALEAARTVVDRRPARAIPMRHDFAARPLHRFNENVILAVFRHQTEAGTFVLQTARNIYPGAVCMVAAGDVKQALLDAVRNPSTNRPAGRRWRYWRYQPPVAWQQGSARPAGAMD